MSPLPNRAIYPSSLISCLPVCASTGYPEFAGENNIACFQNQNASNPVYHDLTPNNWVNRQWNWMLCNEP